ncbi:MAG: efflux transporter outer membrane subunit, partial [Rickettsiales bacterium]|nr:efflux transporter outer membrane subunit [Rickettsiales bacterium]
LNDNPGINQTRTRLEQAAAVAGKTYADLLPSASITGERRGTRTENTSSDSLSLSGAASYELDIWGKNRAAAEADILEAQASLQDLNVASITLSASVVENWLRLRALRAESRMIADQIDTNTTILDLQHERYANGSGSLLDVLQQKETLESSKAQLPDIQTSQELILHQLAALVGKNPGAHFSVGGDSIPKIPALPATGLPSTLLETRPDIEAAWLRLRSADWATSAAVRDRLPAFTLSANITSSATKLSGLFDSWLLNLVAEAALPILDGGERRAEVLRQKARADERFHAYRETVIGAIAEVEDALTQNHFQLQKCDAITRQLESARAALEQAQLSYSNGDTGYINVLTSLRSVQSLERQYVQAERDLALFRVALYRALGVNDWHQKEQKPS